MRWLAVLLLALLAAWVAPRDWPEDGLRLQVVGEQTTVVPLASGRAGPWIVDVQRGSAIQVVFEGPPIESLALVLPDGTVEPVVLEVDGAHQQGSRTPPRSASLLFPLFIVVVALWLTEALPLWATGLLVPVVVTTAGIAPAAAALQPFFDPIIALFFAGFALAIAFEEVGLDQRVSTALLARLGDRPRALFAGLLALSAVASMFMSNTAAAATLVPLAMAATAALGPSGQGYQRALVLGVAYAATLGGVGSAIGTPANPLAMELLGRQGYAISFLGWFGFGLPVVALLLPVVGGLVWWWFVDALPTRFDAVQVHALQVQAETGPLDRRSWRVGGVFVATVAGWSTQPLHGVHPGVVGLLAVVGLVAGGVFTTSHLARVRWGVLLTFGGGLALGEQLSSTGSAEWLATRLVGLEIPSAALAVGLVALASLLLTMVASNTASAAILIPLALPMARVLGLDPTLLVVVIAVASSIDFAMVIGTPPTMVAYSTDRFTVAEIFRLGVLLDAVALLVLLLVAVPLWWVLGLVAG